MKKPVLSKRLRRYRTRHCMAVMLLLLPWSSDAAAQEPGILFGVAHIDTSSKSESYVLPLTDPVDIANARALIAEGSQSGVGSIVVARIEAGADGVNRNWIVPSRPEWSWHVVEFLEFAEITVEICDGSPNLVENDVGGWIANTGGEICFWTYTVVKELGTVPVEPATWSRIKRLYSGE